MARIDMLLLVVGGVIALAAAAPYVSTLAGLAGNSGSTNGYGSAARFTDVVGFGARGFLNPSNTILISDRGNGMIRTFDVTNNYVGTKLSGATQITAVSNPDSSGNVYHSDQSANFYKLTPGGINTLLTSIRSYGIWVSELDGYVYTTDLNSCPVWKVNPSTGAKTLYAGSAGTCSYNGPGYRTSTYLYYPLNMQMTPNNDMYFMQYIGYAATKIDGTTGIVSIVAGTYAQSGNQPGPVGTARFGSYPYGLGVSCDGQYIYIGDAGNGHIWQVYNNYASVLVSGNGHVDGPLSTARTSFAWGFDATEAGKLYFNEYNYYTIRVLTDAPHGGCNSNYCCGATYDECNHLASVCPAMASTVSSLNTLCSGGYTDACAVASALSTVATICSQLSANCQALISHC